MSFPKTAHITTLSRALVTLITEITAQGHWTPFFLHIITLLSRLTSAVLVVFAYLLLQHITADAAAGWEEFKKTVHIQSNAI